ncbi:hypothetical protein ElyMa_002481800 [Elysia marginata]|uniref:Secreted protein n=1 Tax=Elysia marginata TaxID=1093978 RepID=A0AAV4GQ01_9GAST|nr:hypothetical protein ElyMa_002481800 [Elysia marginata]
MRWLFILPSLVTHFSFYFYNFTDSQVVSRFTSTVPWNRERRKTGERKGGGRSLKEASAQGAGAEAAGTPREAPSLQCEQWPKHEQRLIKKTTYQVNGL